jgi:glycine/D-amino acid oxidase-like deaminating enzyme
MDLDHLQIGIVGAGIGGLALAALLAQAGAKVQVIVRFTAARAIGSRLVVQPVGIGDKTDPVPDASTKRSNFNRCPDAQIASSWSCPPR